MTARSTEEAESENGSHLRHFPARPVVCLLELIATILTVDSAECRSITAMGSMAGSAGMTAGGAPAGDWETWKYLV